MSQHDERVEFAIRELQSLAKRHPLKGSDLENAKRFMATLREAGYTNQEISDLTKGAWSEATVKLYSRGTDVKDSTIKHTALNLLSELVSRGLTMNDVQSVLSLKRDLDSAGLKIEDLSLLLGEATRVGIDIKPLVQLFQDVRESLPEASIDDLANIIAYKTELVRLGIGTPELQNIVNALRNYGEPSKILVAISTFGSIKSIEEKIDKLSAEKDGLDAKVSSLRSEIEHLENKKATLQSSLEQYDNLRSAGFDQAALAILADTCKKYGDNVKPVLEAVNSYAKLIDIQLEVDEVQARKKEEEKKLKLAEGKYAHLQTVMGMSNTLLYDLEYSVSTIRQLHDMAKKYDSPEEVYNAVGRYGDLMKIEEQIQNLLKKRTELESKIKEMHTQLVGLRGHADSIKESMRGLLQPLSIEITKTVENTFQKITSVYTEQIAIIKKESKEYGNRLGQATALQEELKLARIINSLEKYPAEAKNLDPGYAVLLLGAVEKYCWASHMDPKIALKDALVNARTIHSDSEVYVHELIDGARRGLFRGFGAVR
jgi:predicted  nucleic acid-binding Zn-ribbon protein